MSFFSFPFPDSVERVHRSSGGEEESAHDPGSASDWIVPGAAHALTVCSAYGEGAAFRY